VSEEAIMSKENVCQPSTDAWQNQETLLASSGLSESWKSLGGRVFLGGISSLSEATTDFKAAANNGDLINMEDLGEGHFPFNSYEELQCGLNGFQKVKAVHFVEMNADISNVLGKDLTTTGNCSGDISVGLEELFSPSRHSRALSNYLKTRETELNNLERAGRDFSKSLTIGTFDNVEEVMSNGKEEIILDEEDFALLSLPSNYLQLPGMLNARKDQNNIEKARTFGQDISHFVNDNNTNGSDVNNNAMAKEGLKTIFPSTPICQELLNYLKSRKAGLSNGPTVVSKTDTLNNLDTDASSSDHSSNGDGQGLQDLERLLSPSPASLEIIHYLKGNCCEGKALASYRNNLPLQAKIFGTIKIGGDTDLHDEKTVEVTSVPSFRCPSPQKFCNFLKACQVKESKKEKSTAYVFNNASSGSISILPPEIAENKRANQ